MGVATLKNEPSNDQLVKLLATVRHMGIMRNIDELLPFLAKHCIEAIGADRCTVFIVDEDRGEIWSRYAEGEKDEIRFSIGVGVAGECIRSRRILVIEDAYAHPLFNPKIDRQTGYRTKNILCVPLRTLDGHVNGCFQVVNKNEGEFTEKDKSTLLAFASQAAISLESVLLLDEKNRVISRLSEVEKELRHTTHKLAAVYDIERLVHKNIGFRGVADAALGHIMDSISRINRAFLVDSNSGQGYSMLVDRDIVHFSISDDEKIKLQPGNNLDFLEGYFSSQGIDSPVINHRLLQSTNREVLGVVGICFAGQTRMNDADETLLDIIGGQLSSVLERKANIAQKAHQDRLATVGQLLATIVHDFRSPMASAHSACEYMKMSEEIPHEEVISMCNIAQGALDRCNTMVDELLQFAAGRKNIVLKLTELKGFFYQLTLSLEAQAKIQNCTLILELEAEGSVMVDKEKLFRVIYNLANNSFEAMDSGGVLKVRAANKKKCLEIRVEDTGPGIPDEIKGSIMNAFFTHGKSKGTGLGLHIAKEIIEAHQGSLYIDNDYTQGACFVIELPI